MQRELTRAMSDENASERISVIWSPDVSVSVRSIFLSSYGFTILILPFEVLRSSSGPPPFTAPSKWFLDAVP